MPNTGAAGQSQRVTETPSLTGESFGRGPDAVPVSPLLEAVELIGQRGDIHYV